MIATLAALALLVPGQQQAAIDPTATVVPDVIVEGRPVRETAREYVDQVAAPALGARIARWRRGVCVSVSNMQADYAQSLIERIGEVARDVGLEVGGPDCQANVIIMATSDGAGLARRLVSGNTHGFRPALGGTDSGARALERFQTSDAAIRWWHVAAPLMGDTNETAIRLRGEPPRQRRVREASRLTSTIRHDLAWVLIILDVEKAGDVTFGAISDYAAMAALAQLDPEAELGRVDSVLSAFDGPGSPEALTPWDLAYLRGLYDIRTDQFDARGQRIDLARAVAAQRSAIEATRP